MPNTLIPSNPDFKREQPKSSYLKVAEFFSDTIQGEGINTGVPATFLRLKDCTLDCIWCDTKSVWRFGNPYTYDELFDLMDRNNLPLRLKKGQHLILTGGSPLKQQIPLIEFIEEFRSRYGFIPYIEVENEAVLRIMPEFAELVSCWNNSPKLANSGMREAVRYKPQILSHTAKMQNSWFKFVVSDWNDWGEIDEFFIKAIGINKKQIILMPCGENQIELAKTREIAVEMAISAGVRFCDRLHVTIWDKKTGV